MSVQHCVAVHGDVVVLIIIYIDVAIGIFKIIFFPSIPYISEFYSQK
jgi:hypothetical protein